MAQTVALSNPPIACTLKKVRRSKHIRISVFQDGRVLVTAPYYESYKNMERFLRAKEAWIVTQVSNIKINPSQVVLGGTSAHYKEHKKAARQFIVKRLAELNAYYGFTYNRVSIRNQRTRWGSCAANGNLSFSYKLLFLPPHLADYIMVHELCHLAELNHGRKFWTLVERACPNYRAFRRELKGVVG